MYTTPPSTPDAVLSESTAPVEPLDALLHQIVNGFFVLTDGQGAVSKWSEPAELLFGRNADQVLGQGFFETLIGGALSPAADAWRRFLDAGEPPVAPGRVEVGGRHADGSARRRPDRTGAGTRPAPGRLRCRRRHHQPQPR